MQPFDSYMRRHYVGGTLNALVLADLSPLGISTCLIGSKRSGHASKIIWYGN